jgi:hypothetical protein
MNDDPAAIPDPELRAQIAALRRGRRGNSN